MGTRKKFRVNRPDFQLERQSSLDSLARSCRRIARMRGRGDGRFQSRGGGRGRYGRGQGEPHKPISKGRKPEVGAYLDLRRGQAADPESVLKWLECFRVYMYSTYESTVKEIIGIDGIL